jgi:hypothetical protein
MKLNPRSQQSTPRRKLMSGVFSHAITCLVAAALPLATLVILLLIAVDHPIALIGTPPFFSGCGWHG